MINTQSFWKAALIRAVKTFFQTFLATAGTATLLTDVHWMQVLSASSLAAILSVATSIVMGLPEVDSGDT